jgi:hypothetical protein
MRAAGAAGRTSDMGGHGVEGTGGGWSSLTGGAAEESTTGDVVANITISHLFDGDSC